MSTVQDLLAKLEKLDPATWQAIYDASIETGARQDYLIQGFVQDAIVTHRREYDIGYHWDQGETPAFAWCYYETDGDIKLGKLEYGKTVVEALLKAYIEALESMRAEHPTTKEP